MWLWLYRLELVYLAAMQRWPLFSGVHWQSFWQNVSRCGDPLTAFSTFFPLLFAWNERMACGLLVSAAFSEFLNGVFKWLLVGHRPYWLAAELGFRTKLLQYPLTCETGPGSPSGHMMVTAAVGYVLVKTIRHRLARNIAWICYFALLAGIGLSRVYIATHFPHQIVLGCIAGITCGYLVLKWQVDLWPPGKVLTMATFLTAIGFSTYRLLLMWGIDPDWSIVMARKHCADKRWVHVSTTPITSAVRDIGALCGYALAMMANSNYRRYDTYSVYHGRSIGQCVVVSAVSCAFAFLINALCDMLPLVEMHYYECVFGANLLAVCFTVVIMPVICKNVAPLKFASKLY